MCLVPSHFHLCLFIFTLEAFSGLFAARFLQEEHGINVVVLEARDRVGGRTFTVSVRISSWMYSVMFCELL